ncbi:hypothetical protein LTS10_002611 [Elasticomyces elasticus]|nr:hypothetical protein LTS10_002611 [Elasticomyces elasticus]
MAATALLQHYIEYLTTPTVLLTILVVVGPILYTVGVERAIASKTVKPSGLPGCRRLGLVGPSNLSTQHDQPPLTDGIPRVKALFTYPIKSCRGVELSATEVEATGLKFDRLMTFAQLVSKPVKKADKDQAGAAVPSEEWQHQWRFITQREFPRLALLRTELWVPDPRGRTATANGHGGKDLKVPASKPRTRSRTRGSTLVGQLEKGDKAAGSGDWTAQGGCLVVRFPFEPDFNPLGLRTQEVKLVLPLVPTIERAKAKQYTTEDLSIWKDNPQALNLTCEIDKVALEKLRYFLGVSNPLALFRVDPNKPRAVTRCLPVDKPGEEFKVGFADAFPVNILGLASVRKTDAELPATADVKGKLDARRFRANIYIEGVEAFAEDEWKKIIAGTRIGRDKDGLFECDAEYHVACRTARCTLPNVHPDTGIKDKNEPYTTLGKTRKVDKGALPHPCLGVHTIPLFASGILRVGDEIEVLQKGEHVYEKMFNAYDKHSVRAEHTKPHIWIDGFDTQRARAALSMTMTCREVRAETLAMFYHLNIFVLRSPAHRLGRGKWGWQREKEYVNSLTACSEWLKTLPACASNAMTLHVKSFTTVIGPLGKRPAYWWKCCRRVETQTLHKVLQPSSIRQLTHVRLVPDWKIPSQCSNCNGVRIPGISQCDHIVYDLPAWDKSESRRVVEWTAQAKVKEIAAVLEAACCVQWVGRFASELLAAVEDSRTLMLQAIGE